MQAQGSSGSLALRERLGTKKKKLDHDASDGGQQCATPNNMPSTQSLNGPLPLRTYPKREKEKLEIPLEQISAPRQTVSPEDQSVLVAEDLRAIPSVFAQTMLGAHISSKHGQPTGDNLFTLPYPGSSTSTNDPFAGPSPDDVVLQAQSKGSRG